MSHSLEKFRMLVVKICILVALLFGPSSGQFQSLHLKLENAMSVLSGRSNKINFTATVIQNGNIPGCGPWGFYMWTSPTDDTDRYSTTGEMQVLDDKQRNLEFEEGQHALTFENVTYNVNLRNISCEEVKFVCGRFLGFGGNARCSSAVLSCIPIACKAVLIVQGMTVATNTPSFHIHDPNNFIQLNVTVDYNMESGMDIPSRADLWTMRVWLSAFSNGTRPRWSLIEQTLTGNQSSQALMAGEQLAFENVMYAPKTQELENVLCEQVHFVCVRFRSDTVQLEGRRGSVRTNCTELPPCHMATTTGSNPTTTQPTTPQPTTDLPMTTLPTTILPASTPPSTSQLVSTPTATNQPTTTTITSPMNEPTTDKLTDGVASTNTNSPLETQATTHEEMITPIALTLEELSEIDVTSENIETVAKNLVALTTGVMPDTTNYLQAVSTTLQNIANVQPVTAEIVELSLTTVDNILQLDQNMLQQGFNTKMVKSLQKILANLNLDSDGDNFASALKNIALVALSMRAEDAINGITFNVKSKPKESNETVSVEWSYDEYISSEKNTGLTFPGDLFHQDGIIDIRTNVIVYLDDKLFKVPQQTNQSGPTCPDVSGNVIGAELLVNGNHVTQLNPDVKMIFNMNERNSTLQPSCAFWDFNKAGNHGDWSSVGCHVVQDVGRQVMCRCNHLTNFAIIMSPENGCHRDPYFLDVLSKIGCVVSITALFLTFLTYTVYKKLMGRTPQLILIQWTLSLLCLYIVFLFGIDKTHKPTFCTIVAALLHYFTLTSIFWMGAEAASLFLVFVKGIRVVPRPQKFLPIAAVIAWGLPALIAIIPFLFVRVDEYRHSNYCFLIQGPHFYYGLLLPIGSVLLTNIIVFILVLNAITCRRPDMSSSSLAKTQSNDGTRMIQQVLCIAVLLGITWVFGFFSIGSAAPVFSALFTIFNSFQGLAVFLLFCVRRREVREAWRKSFSCTQKQTYYIGHYYRSRSGTATSRTDIYNINVSGYGYRSRSGTVCSRTDGISASAALDKV